MSNQELPPAGLTYAPPYDQTQELDPRSVQPVLIPSGDLSKLEYYQQLHARHTLWARAALLVVIFGGLAINAWLTNRNYEALVINMDQTRMAQSDIDEARTRQISDLQSQIARLETEIAAMRAAAEAGTTVAAR